MRVPLIAACMVHASLLGSAERGGLEDIPPIRAPAVRHAQDRVKMFVTRATAQADLGRERGAYSVPATEGDVPGMDMLRLATLTVPIAYTPPTNPNPQPNDHGPPMVSSDGALLLAQVIADALDASASTLLARCAAEAMMHRAPVWEPAEALGLQSMASCLSMGSETAWAGAHGSQRPDIMSLGVAALIDSEFQTAWRDSTQFSRGYGARLQALKQYIAGHSTASGAFHAIYYDCYTWGPIRMGRMRAQAAAEAAGVPFDPRPWDAAEAQARTAIEGMNTTLNQNDKMEPAAVPGTWDPAWIAIASQVVDMGGAAIAAASFPQLYAADKYCMRLVDLSLILSQAEAQPRLRDLISAVSTAVANDVRDAKITKRITVTQTQTPGAGSPGQQNQTPTPATSDTQFSGGDLIPLSGATITAISNLNIHVCGSATGTAAGATTGSLLGKSRWQATRPMSWPVRTVGNTEGAQPGDITAAKDALAYAAHFVIARMDSLERHAKTDIEYSMYLGDINTLKSLTGIGLNLPNPANLSNLADIYEQKTVIAKDDGEDLLQRMKTQISVLKSHAARFRDFTLENNPVPGWKGRLGANVADMRRLVAMIRAALVDMRNAPSLARSYICANGFQLSADPLPERMRILADLCRQLGLPQRGINNR